MPDKNYEMKLIFSGNAAIKLKVEAIEAHLTIKEIIGRAK